MPAGHCGSCFTYVINPQHFKELVFNILSIDIFQQTENEMQKNAQVNSSVALGNVLKQCFLEILMSILGRMVL